MTKEEMSALYHVDIEKIERFRRLDLIGPKRQEDGSFLYFQEDGEMLQRLVVLEVLGFSEIDFTHLKYKDKTLETLLQTRLHKLEGCLGKEICRQILEEGADLHSFAAEKYLEQLNNHTTETVLRIKPGFRNHAFRPWRRYFARGLDVCLYGIIWYILLGYVLHINLTKDSLGLDAAGWIVTAVLMILIEPILLNRFGTTFGKWVFGLKIEKADGTRLSYGEGLHRTWVMFGKGSGYGIPIYNLVRNYKSYKLCKEEEIQPWDEGLSYTIKDTKGYRIAAFLAFNIFFVFIVVVLLMGQMLPPNRGDITLEEFAENYNYFCNYFEYKENWYMDASGNLIERPDERSVVINLGSGESPKLNYQVENGILTGVSFVYEVKDEEVFSQPERIEKSLLGFAFGSTDKEVGLIWNSGDSILTSVLYAENFDLSVGNMRYFSTVEKEGYEEDRIYLIPLEGAAESYYKMEFSVTREDQP